MGNSRIKNKKEEILYELNNGVSLKELSKKYGYKRQDNFKKQLIKDCIIPDENGTYVKPKTYKCEYCGAEFESNQKLGGHINFCINGPNREKNLKILEKNRKNIDYEKKILKCKFCDKEVLGEGCLFLHERSCKKNPDRIPRKVSSKGKSHVAWNKGKTFNDDYRILKAMINRKKTIENGDYIPHKTPHTNETKEILRQKMIEYVKEHGDGGFGQHYSKKGCEYIDKLNEEKGWHLQHALNGGEVEVAGYFLDGYDIENNIAFEYDEPKHYKDVYNNILNEKDIERQTTIINRLHCRLFRYNEKINLLYEI